MFPPTVKWLVLSLVFINIHDHIDIQIGQNIQQNNLNSKVLNGPMYVISVAHIKQNNMNIGDFINDIDSDISDIISTDFEYVNTVNVPNRSDTGLSFERGDIKKGKILKT